MTPESLSSLAGILLSLAFSYIPGLAPLYEAAEATQKRLVMLAALLAVAAAFYAWSWVQQTPAELAQLLEVFVLALVANQSTYLLSPKRLSSQQRS